MSDFFEILKGMEARISILERYGNNLGVQSTPTALTPGNTGDIKYDNSYLYIKTTTAWKKIALASL